MKKILLLLVSGFLFSSCATIFCGSKSKVVFDSNDVKVADELIIDGRKYKDVEFPYVQKVKRGFDESIVVARAKGYEDTTLYIDKNFNAVSVINLFDILGWGIDAATGAMMKPEFKFYEIEFKSTDEK